MQRSVATPVATPEATGTVGRRWLGARLVGIAAAWTALIHVLTARVGIDLGDEGFLWYGVQRAAAGGVPLRDFQAYDPGRYYWCAAWSLLFGDGLLAVRLSCAIFQAIGLAAGLFLLRRLTSSIGWVVLLAGVLAVWMFPRYKVFESSLALMAVLGAVRLVERPSLRRHVEAGLFVGLAAFVGRNHGLYCGIAYGALALWIPGEEPDGRAMRTLARRLAALSAGVVVGYLPMLVMMAVVPGLGEAVVDSVLLYGERGTNLSKPIPWPWTLDLDLPMSKLAPRLGAGVGYVVMVLVYAAGLVWLLARGRRAIRRGDVPGGVLVAAVCVGIPYAHHACIRAAPFHLAQAVHPLLLASAALLVVLVPGRALVHRGAWVALGAWAAFIAWGVHPQLELRGAMADVELVEHDVAGDVLRLAQAEVGLLGQVGAVVSDRIPAGASIFIAPYRVTYYPALGRVAPTWDIYMLWRASDEHQREMIADLEAHGTDWAIIVDEYLGSPDRAFGQTHPLLARYFRRHFVPVVDRRLPLGHVLLRRRAPAQR